MLTAPLNNYFETLLLYSQVCPEKPKSIMFEYADPIGLKNAPLFLFFSFPFFLITTCFDYSDL